jgi:hypothetical protein
MSHSKQLTELRNKRNYTHQSSTFCYCYTDLLIYLHNFRCFLQYKYDFLDLHKELPLFEAQILQTQKNTKKDATINVVLTSNPLNISFRRSLVGNNLVA